MSKHNAMAMMVSYVFLTTLLLLFLTRWLLLHFLSSRRKANSLPPSPPSLPLLGHLHLLKKPLHCSLAALAARHDRGTGLLLLRFGAKPVLLVSSPVIAEECFTVHDITLADRPRLASRQLLTDDCPSISTASYGPHWRHLRRIATVHALSTHQHPSTAAFRNAEARAMARKLWQAGAGAVNVKATAFELVVNEIMAMVAGKRMSEEEVLRFKAMTEAGFAAAGAANKLDFLPALRLLDFGRVKGKLKSLAKARKEFAQGLVDDYRRSHAAVAIEREKSTVIGDLLRLQWQSPELHGDEVIRTVCLAGTDTSASTIEWAMALLLNNPVSLKKAAAEIIATVGTSRILEESDVAGLPYLRCIVTETLRLCPVAPLLAPHESSQDCLVGGGRHAVARGTMVLVDVYSMQRDPAAWEAPDRFVPERFLGGGPGDAGWMLPFGMGRRRCPGEGLAVKTIGLALGVMIQCFEWERVGEEVVDMSEGSGLIMPMAVPLVAMCRPRAEMATVLMAL